MIQFTFSNSISLTEVIKKPLYSGVFLAFLLFSFPWMMHAQTLAFPGAEGYGSYSEGGRGGEILKVTNLNDSGPGSLREAVNHDGPRIIVFEVSGIIDLDSTLVISHPRITIAGHTSPNTGITIRGEQTKIETNHVVIRFIRFRPGDINERRNDGTDWNGMDAVDIGLEDSDEVHDIILDHCSFSWATDENIGIWHNSRNITIQNSIISEPLHKFKQHEQHPYPGQGLLIGAQVTNISILKNLFAHNFERHPYMNANGHLDFRNNVIYNAGGSVARFQNAQGVKQTVNFVNNYIKPGPDSRYDYEVLIRRTSRTRVFNGKLFIDGNISEGKMYSDNWQMVVDQILMTPYPDGIRSEEEFEHINTTTLHADELMRRVKPNAGAYLPVRDQIDERILYDVKNGTGKLISKTSDVFGWAKTDAKYRKLDPHNHWQNNFEITLSNHQEASADYNGNGYTNIEEFLNGTNPREDESDKRITDIYPPGSITTSSTGVFNMSVTQSSPNNFTLHNNYPNPFNSSTNFHLTVVTMDTYKLDIFNNIGQRVALILDQRLHPGDYEMRWKPSQLPSGVYFVRLSSGGDFQVNKINLIK